MRLPSVFLSFKPGLVSVEPDTPPQVVANFAVNNAREAIGHNRGLFDDEGKAALESVEKQARALEQALSMGNQSAALAAIWNVAAWCSEAYRREAAAAMEELKTWDGNTTKRVKVANASRDSDVTACFRRYCQLMNGGHGERKARKVAREEHSEVSADALRKRIQRSRDLARRKSQPGK